VYEKQHSINRHDHFYTHKHCGSGSRTSSRSTAGRAAYPGLNTAEGGDALLSLPPNGGIANTAVGWSALGNTSGASLNTAMAAGALLANNGEQNTATGAAALLNNIAGAFNTAGGAFVLFSNNAGLHNVAVGWYSLAKNTEGTANTAVGGYALLDNTTGENNTAVGNSALVHSSGSGNTALGFIAGNGVTTANNVICIGNGVAGANVNDTTWIGNIYGVTTQSGTTAQVIVSDTGQLGTVASSERFKKDIATMDRASEAILSLRPVTFHYKSDTKSTRQYGLIAEEVAKVSATLVLADRDGKPYPVRYDAVNAMLLNEFLKEHRRVDELKSAMAQQREDFEAAIVQQRKATEALVARVNEQEAQIQKVSAKIEVGNSGSQMLVKNQ
jgi:hypothetical protein